MYVFDFDFTKPAAMLKAEVEALAKAADLQTRVSALLSTIPAQVEIGEIKLREPHNLGESAALEIHIAGRSDWFSAALPLQTIPYFNEMGLLLRRCKHEPKEISFTIAQVKEQIGDLINHFNNVMARQIEGMEKHLSALLRERMRVEKQPETIDDVLARHGVTRAKNSD